MIRKLYPTIELSYDADKRVGNLTIKNGPRVCAELTLEDIGFDDIKRVKTFVETFADESLYTKCFNLKEYFTEVIEQEL